MTCLRAVVEALRILAIKSTRSPLTTGNFDCAGGLGAGGAAGGIGADVDRDGGAGGGGMKPAGGGGIKSFGAGGGGTEDMPRFLDGGGGGGAPRDGKTGAG